MADAATGVILLYMGGPETLAQVEPFLRELFSDRDLIQLPGGRLLQGPFARLISSRRAPRVRARYELLGGGSPLLRISRQQAEALQAALAPHGAFQVELAMRYAPPRADEAVGRLMRAGVGRCVALPLYPHYSGATTGSSFRDLARAVSAANAGLDVVRVDSFHDHPRYLDALAATVEAGLEQLGPGATVVFSAHSLPRKMVERGDPYQAQVEATVAGVVSRLQLERWHLGYQSRSGPVRWLEPDVVDLVRRLGRQRTRELLVVPVSFVSDHIETLHELDIELRDLALESGVDRFARAPALNDHPLFIEALTELVLTANERDEPS